MARTALGKPLNLFRSDTTESVFIITATVADAGLVATQAELDASTTYTVSAAIDAVSGWETSRSSLVVSIKGTTGFPVRLAGPKETPDASITFWADQLGVDIKSILDEGDTVYVVFAPNSDTAASYMEVWKAKVQSISRLKQFGGEAARVRVMFDVLDANERALIPA